MRRIEPIGEPLGGTSEESMAATPPGARMLECRLGAVVERLTDAAPVIRASSSLSAEFGCRSRLRFRLAAFSVRSIDSALDLMEARRLLFSIVVRRRSTPPDYDKG